MTNIRQTQVELKRNLDEQLELLSRLADAYDTGNTLMAKPMATCIRILVHDTLKSHSLLSQLGLKSGKFLSTAVPKEDKPNMVRVGSYSALLAIASGSKSGYTPYLDDLPFGQTRMLNFDDYWHEEIFTDANSNSFTRKDIVLYVANQDGGAHVDPELEKKYIELTRQNSLGWKVSNDGRNWTDLTGAELASIRQIGHELLWTLIPSYPTKKITNQSGLMIGAAGIFLEQAKKPTGSDIIEVGRNKPCPCGSGKKYKRCHGKAH